LKTNHLANPGENFFQSSHPDADLPTVCTSSGLLVIFFGRKKMFNWAENIFKNLFRSIAHNDDANEVTKNRIAMFKVLHPWRDANPRSSVSLAETMTTTPRRQGLSCKLTKNWKRIWLC
jgi:hypothetical protein